MSFAFLQLTGQIIRIRGGSRCGIRDAVRHHNFEHIFFRLCLTGRTGTGRRRRCAAANRSESAALDTCVHVGLVVITDIHKIAPLLHSAGERLQANVGCATVACKARYNNIVHPLLPQNPAARPLRMAPVAGERRGKRGHVVAHLRVKWWGNGGLRSLPAGLPPFFTEDFRRQPADDAQCKPGHGFTAVQIFFSGKFFASILPHLTSIYSMSDNASFPAAAFSRLPYISADALRAVYRAGSYRQIKLTTFTLFPARAKRPRALPSPQRLPGRGRIYRGPQRRSAFNALWPWPAK